jgi:Raf kinase inhibitor-like YbhB/YbcL family protein
MTTLISNTAFTLSGPGLAEGRALPTSQMSGAMGVPGGKDESPELNWSGAPEGTRSFVLTVYDPDAPTGSGFWHWTVVNIPAHVTSLLAGVGNPRGIGLPAGARQLPNDAGLSQYVGAAPPPGHGAHRYVVTLSALDTASLLLADTMTPAMLGLVMRGHVLAKATLTPIAWPVAKDGAAHAER